jgi:hypothetical protein
LEAFNVNCLQFEEDERLSVQLLVNHASKDAHHSGTALVELLGAECVLLFFGLVTEESNGHHGSTKVLKDDERQKKKVRKVKQTASRKWQVSVLTYTGEGVGVLDPKELEHTNVSNNLGNASTADSGKGRESIGDIGELGSRKVDVSGETDTSSGDKVSEEGKLGNTSVLDLNVTKTVEGGFVATGEQAKGIEESKRGLDTELVLERHVGGDRSPGGLLGRGKGSGGGDEGGNDNRLHDVCSIVEIVCLSQLLANVSKLSNQSERHPKTKI